MPLTRLRSPRDFFRVWFFWKTQAVIAFFVIVGLVMFYAYVCTPEYESTAKIVLLPSTKEESVISAKEDITRILPVSPQQVNTEMELIYSDEILRETVRSFQDNIGLKLKDKGIFGTVADFIKGLINKAMVITGLKFAPSSRLGHNVELLRDSLEVECTPDSNVIFVTLRSENPEAAAVVLNRLLDVYVRHHNRVFTQEGGVRFFNEKWMKYGKALKEAETKLKMLEKNSSIVNLAEQNKTNIELLGEFTKELNYMEVSYDAAASRIALLKKALAKNIDRIVITKEMREIPAIVELEKEIVPLLVKRSAISKSFTRASREYRDIDGQIAMLRGEIRKKVEDAIRTDELELDSLGAKKESLANKIAILKKNAIELDQKEKALQDLKRQIELYRRNYMLYASKTENARVYAEGSKRNLANVSIAERAYVPEKPAYPNRLLFLFVSVFFGVFVAGLLPFILESFDSRLKTPDDVTNLLSLPVVSSFPDVKNQA